MEKVIIFCRCSTEHQQFLRQINELTEFCNGRGWEIVKVVANKVSGKLPIEQRPEVLEMLDYIEHNKVDKVCCLEISRLGRNTLEALKVIQMLTDRGVSLYIKNYNLETLNPDGKVNPVASLITTILLEIAQMERLTIIERMASGRDQYIRRCRETGEKMGRPATYRKSDDEYREEYKQEISLLRKGISLRNITKITGTSVNTLRKLERFL